jgi:hypothetical protein
MIMASEKDNLTVTMAGDGCASMDKNKLPFPGYCQDQAAVGYCRWFNPFLILAAGLGSRKKGGTTG